MISYRDMTRGGLRFAERNETGWRTELVDRGSDLGFGTAMRNDSMRTTVSHVRLGKSLRFAERVGGSWSNATVFEGYVAGGSSLAVGPGGNRAIAFAEGAASPGLNVALETPSGWTVSLAYSTRRGVFGPSISAFGGTYGIAFAAGDYSGQWNVHVATGDGSSWANETVATRTGPAASAGFDSTGVLHVAYVNGTDLVHARRDGTTWTRGIVERGVGADVSGFSLAVGPDDVPRLAYWTPAAMSARRQLWYAVGGPSNWSRSLVAEVEGGNWVSLAVDSLGHPHIAFAELGYPVQDVGDLWYATTRPPAGNRGPDAVLAVSGPGVEGAPVSFDASGSSDPDADPLVYRWDFQADGVWDTPWSSEPRTSFVYGDDFRGSTRVEVGDGSDTSTAEAPVTVLNADPTIDGIRAFTVVDVTLRVSGEKWHDVRLDLTHGGETRTAIVVRSPGSPDAQAAVLEDVSFDRSLPTAIGVHYTPDDDPVNGRPNGATPVWIVFAGGNGAEERLQHTFNVQHPDGWTWIPAGVAAVLARLPTTFEAAARDPGSDDLTVVWSWGDGTPDRVTTYYNDGAGPDQFPSPEMKPITVRDRAAHRFASTGTYTVILTVTDDDGGTVSSHLVVTAEG